MTIFAESERLILRRPRPDDLEPLLLAWADPELNRWTTHRDDPRTFLVTLIADMADKSPGDADPGGPWFQYIVERREDGEVVGDLGAGFNIPGERQVELGYRILPAFQRQGYAREAVATLIDHLIETHRVHRFGAVAAAPNDASVAVLRSLGFREEGRFVESFPVDGAWVDDLAFALLARDWRG